jgi:uncharacterized protein (TIGR03000 family)
MLVAGSSSPAWHHCHSCYSCYSCYSGYSGYSGYGCYGGCSCYSCHGCHSYPGYRLFHHGHSYCSSCYCSSCYCSGCYCSGSYYYGCSSCYSSCSSCYGCCSSVIVTEPRVIPVQGGNSEVDALRKEVERLRKELEKREKIPNPKKDEEVATPTKVSRVTVTLPANARLWIENIECPLTSSVRTFDTPPLRSNQQYFYNVKMEVMQNGQLVSQTQKAIITPGRPVQVDFNGNAAVTTASR